MLRMNELHERDIYQHDNGKIFARLIRWQGTDESGGAATVEMAGVESTMGLAIFMRKFNTITVSELPDARQNQG